MKVQTQELYSTLRSVVCNLNSHHEKLIGEVITCITSAPIKGRQENQLWNNHRWKRGKAFIDILLNRVISDGSDPAKCPPMILKNRLVLDGVSD